ncbi:MAG: ribonuclease H-like domain-containing protein [Planctomycetales bacterium]|nr:ribonuclease H-like domain-containing protein [bacterium]UNM08671.1 MAG: ribonuclease H-like domain-containing protein [Planctomycetales bacterium]
MSETSSLSISARTPIEEVRFSVLDLETTGGAPPEHKITEIAAYHVDGLQITDEFVTLVNPERNIPAFITGLTGINEKMVKDKPPSRDVLPELQVFLGDSILVAHHSQFDRRFLENELELMGERTLHNGDLCTSRLARRIVPWLPSKSLGNLAAFFGISIPDRHRAAGDAYATSELLIIFLKYLKSRGLDTIDQVMEFQHGEMPYPTDGDD